MAIIKNRSVSVASGFYAASPTVTADAKCRETMVVHSATETETESGLNLHPNEPTAVKKRQEKQQKERRRVRERGKEVNNLHKSVLPSISVQNIHPSWRSSTQLDSSRLHSLTQHLR